MNQFAHQSAQSTLVVQTKQFVPAPFPFPENTLCVHCVSTITPAPLLLPPDEAPTDQTDRDISIDGSSSSTPGPSPVLIIQLVSLVGEWGIVE